MTDAEFLTLVMRHQDGALSPGELAALESELRGDAARRRLFASAQVRAQMLHEQFRRAAFQVVSEPKTRHTAWRERTRNWLPYAAAACVAMSLLGGWLLARHGTVARLGALENCRWMDSSWNPSRGEALRRGQRVELSAGIAVVEFGCGAVTTLRGPAVLEVLSAKSARLHLGAALTVADTPAARGFTLRTRHSRIVDLGTEFVTTADADGRVRVEVSSGEVLVHADGHPAPQHLSEGASLTLEPGRARVIVRVEHGDGSPAFRFPTLPPPTDGDDADARRGKARITVAVGALHAPEGRPQDKSGPADVLLDGHGQQNADAPGESAFIEDRSSGALLLDLGAAVRVERIHTYSWHQNPKVESNRGRAHQRYVLYGSADDTAPPVSENAPDAGWEWIAQVNTDEHFGVAQSVAERPAQQVCAITSSNGVLGRYRWLLWWMPGSENRPMRFNANPFYGEFDVFAAPESKGETTTVETIK
jgi:hypothetical protein